MLTPSQARLLRALLTEPTIEAAARAAGVSVRTAYNFRQMPEFAAEYKKACADLLKSASAEMQKHMPAAVNVLADIMNCEGAEDADRIRAARIIIADGLRVAEFADIEERLEALENADDT